MCFIYYEGGLFIRLPWKEHEFNFIIIILAGGQLLPENNDIKR